MLNPLHAAAHVAAGFLSLWKSEVASRAAYYLDPTERMDPDAWDGDPDWETPGSPRCHFCDLPSGHDGPHKDCMCGKCSPVVEVADSIFRSGGQTFQTGPAPKLATTHGGKCKCGHWLHPGNVCAACGCNDVRLAAVSDPPVVPVAVDDCPPVSPATGLTVEQLDWLEPCVLNLLAEHGPNNYCGGIECVDWEGKPHAVFRDHYVWREHWWQELRDRLERAARK